MVPYSNDFTIKSLVLEKLQDEITKITIAKINFFKIGYLTFWIGDNQSYILRAVHRR